MHITISKVINIVFYVFIAYILYLKIPSFYQMWKAQGVQAPSAEVLSLDQKQIKIPLLKKQVIIFWATWCAPCKIELDRMNKLIQENQLKAEDVLAISIQEDLKTVLDYTKNKNFKFEVALDESGQVAQLYDVVGTPTLILVDANGIVHWKTSGISPSLSFRVKNFFNQN